VRILFLTHRLPFAPNRGDRIRAFHLLRRMRQFAEVDIVSLVHDADEAGHVADLEGLATRTWPVKVTRWTSALRLPGALLSATPLTHVLLDAAGMRATLEAAMAHSPDLVLAYCSGMARFALEPPLAGLPFVHDMVDVDSQKWAALASETPGPRRWIYRREARCLAAFERAVTRRAALTLVVNERERRTLEQMAPDARIEALENGVDVDGFSPRQPPASEPTVVFTGVFSYAPNERGAKWLIEEVWPHVVDRCPAARLELVGAQPTAALQALAARTDRVTVTGAVPDVRPYLWNAAVAVAPLHTARGLQNKVLEALAAGLPVVTTTAVAAGLPTAVGNGCLVADAPDLFAEQVTRLLTARPEERRERAASSNLAALTWSARLTNLERLLSQAASSTSAR
jgi:sugar transferase (PEP-CTERM/EpsH1 system associated)